MDSSLDWLWPADKTWPCPYCDEPMPPRSYRCRKHKCRAVYAYFNGYVGGRGGSRRAAWYGDCGRGPVYGLAQLTEFLRRMAYPADDYTRAFAKRYAHRRSR